MSRAKLFITHRYHGFNVLWLSVVVLLVITAIDLNIIPGRNPMIVFVLLAGILGIETIHYFRSRTWFDFKTGQFYSRPMLLQSRTPVPIGSLQKIVVKEEWEARDIYIRGKIWVIYVVDEAGQYHYVGNRVPKDQGQKIADQLHTALHLPIEEIQLSPS